MQKSLLILSSVSNFAQSHCAKILFFFDLGTIFSIFSISLASPKILRLGNEKKNLFSFCISLGFSYLCTQNRDDDETTGYFDNAALWAELAADGLVPGAGDQIL